MRPNPDKLRSLREEAQAAFHRHKYADALARLQELERLQPAEAEWPRRAAECHRALGRKREQIDALGRAAERYVDSGFIVKAIAVCKVILGLEPEHVDTQARLAELQVRWQGERIDTPRAKAVPAASNVEPPTEPTGQGRSPAPAQQYGEGRTRVALEQALRKRRIGHQRPASSQNALVRPPVAPPPLPAPEPVQPVVEHEFVHEEEPSAVTRVSAPAAPISVPPLSSLLPSAPPVVRASGQPSGMHHILLDDVPVPPPDKLQFDEATLSRTGIFAELSPRSLSELIKQSRLMRVEKGTTIVHQGQAAEALFVIVSGSVSVIEEGARGSELTTLAANGFFGESSLITNQPELVSIEAAETTELLVIDRELVQQLIEHEPHTLKILLRSVRERLVEQFLLANDLFTAFSNSERRALSRRFQFLDVTPGSVLIEQGEHAMQLFLLLFGQLEVAHWEGQFAERIAELHEGDAFADISLLTREPSFTEVFSPARAFALMLPEQDLRELIMTHPQMLEFVSSLARRFERLSKPEEPSNSARAGSRK